MFCVLLNPHSEKSSLSETLEASMGEMKDREQAARTKTFVDETDRFGCAYDDLVQKGVAAASSNRMSASEKANTRVFTCSRLLRRMGDPVIAKASMNLKDGEQCSDATIIAQHVASCLARVKWSKGRNVLKALRGMRLAGVQPRSSRRVSVTELGGQGLLPVANSSTPNAGAREETPPDSPKPQDDTPFIPPTQAIDMLKAMNGTFGFVVYDTKRKMVFIARSLDHTLNGKTIAAPALYWAVDTLNGQLLVTVDRSLIPEELAAFEFPAGHFAWVGTSGFTQLPETHQFVEAEQATAPAPEPEKAPVAAEEVAQGAPATAA